MYYKTYYFNVFEFLERTIYAFVAKLSDSCFCWFPAATLVPITIQDRFTSSVWNFWPRIADVTLRDSHVVAGANERRLYSQATHGRVLSTFQVIAQCDSSFLSA